MKGDLDGTYTQTTQVMLTCIARTKREKKKRKPCKHCFLVFARLFLTRKKKIKDNTHLGVRIEEHDSRLRNQKKKKEGNMEVILEIWGAGNHDREI